MAEDRIQQIGEENPIEQSAAEEALKAGLLQAHFSSGEVDSVGGLITDWGGIVTASAVEIADAAARNGVAPPTHWSIRLGIGNKFVPVSIALDGLGDDTWTEAAVKNIMGAIVGEIVGTTAGGALAGALAIVTGSGVIATVGGVSKV